MNLSDQPVGYAGPIREISGDAEFATRLQELGFIRGELVRVVGCALFGDPLIVEVRGAIVALRKKEAQCIQI